MAFTGQRRDWPQHKLLFWKDVLLRVARSLRLCSTPAHLVSRPRWPQAALLAAVSGRDAYRWGDSAQIRANRSDYRELLSQSNRLCTTTYSCLNRWLRNGPLKLLVRSAERFSSDVNMHCYY